MMEDLSIKDLGAFVHLFMKADHPDTAQIYLNEMQVRVTAAKKGSLLHPPVVVTEPNEILAELPVEETTEQTLVHRSARFPETAVGPKPKKAVTLAEVSEANRTEEMKRVIAAIAESPVLEPEGPPRDAGGNITRISVKAGDPGYDPDVHENTNLKILCDGVHIPTAHTADTVAGTVWYHKKNEQGRIKTLEKHGKVEIRGL